MMDHITQENKLRRNLYDFIGKLEWRENLYRESKPYFDAVKKILDGTPVKELEEIRIQCNELNKEMEDFSPYSFDPELLVISFVANA